MIFGSNSYSSPRNSVYYNTGNNVDGMVQQPVYGGVPQYGMVQTSPPPLSSPVVEPQKVVVVHGIDNARNIYSLTNKPGVLFDDEEDIFYYQTADPDGMHQRVRKYRFYEELDGDVVDATPNLIEQKDMTYGDSGLDKERLDKIEKSIEDLATLVELQLEQSSEENKSNTKTSTTKKATNK